MAYPLGSTTVIPFDDTQVVAVLGASGDTYDAFSFPVRDTLSAELTNHYPGGEEVVARIKSWKQSNADQYAVRHEAVFKEALGINAPLRGTLVDFDPLQVPGQISAASELHDLTVSLLDERFGSSFDIYRGANYEQPWLVQSLFDDPSASEHSAPISVLSNYTRSLKGAGYFSRLIIERTVSPADVALATNYLYVFKRDEIVASPSQEDWISSQDLFSPNGELQVRGDLEYPVSTADLSILIGETNTTGAVRRVPIDAFWDACPDFDQEEHAAMAELLAAIGHSSVRIETPEARRRLSAWATEHDTVFDTDLGRELVKRATRQP